MPRTQMRILYEKWLPRHIADLESLNSQKDYKCDQETVECIRSMYEHNIEDCRQQIALEIEAAEKRKLKRELKRRAA